MRPLFLWTHLYREIQQPWKTAAPVSRYPFNGEQYPVLRIACSARPYLDSLSKENGMADSAPLIPATDLAAGNKAHFPNESSEYRQARKARSASPISSAINRASSSTAQCSGRNANARAPCALRC